MGKDDSEKNGDEECEDSSSSSPSAPSEEDRAFIPDIANMEPYHSTNHPVTNVSQPHPHDVLFGRGGGTNHHPGNMKYRKMVEDRKPAYVVATRKGKPQLAFEIIRWVRYEQNPPGRFLKYDNGGWCDVGDKKAREKTSQALREKTSNCPPGFIEGILERGEGDVASADGSTGEKDLSTTQPSSPVDNETKPPNTTNLPGEEESIDYHELPPPLPKPESANQDQNSFGNFPDFESYLQEEGFSLNDEQNERVLVNEEGIVGDPVISISSDGERNIGKEQYVPKTHNVDDLFNSFGPPTRTDPLSPTIKSYGIDVTTQRDNLTTERVGSNDIVKVDERFNSLYDIDNPLPYASVSSDGWNVRDSFENDPVPSVFQGGNENKSKIYCGDSCQVNVGVAEPSYNYGPERLNLDKRATSHNNETSETRRKGCKLIRCPMMNNGMVAGDKNSQIDKEKTNTWNDGGREDQETDIDSIQFKSAPLHYYNNNIMYHPPNDHAPGFLNFMAVRQTNQDQKEQIPLTHDQFPSRNLPLLQHPQWNNSTDQTKAMPSSSRSLQSLRLTSRGLSDGMSTTDEESMTASFRNISIDPSAFEHTDPNVGQMRKGCTKNATYNDLKSIKEPSLSSFMSLELSTLALARAASSGESKGPFAPNESTSGDNNALRWTTLMEDVNGFNNDSNVLMSNTDRESTFQTVSSGILTEEGDDNPSSLSTFEISESIFDAPVPADTQRNDEGPCTSEAAMCSE